MLLQRRSLFHSARQSRLTRTSPIPPTVMSWANSDGDSKNITQRVLPLQTTYSLLSQTLGATWNETCAIAFGPNSCPDVLDRRWDAGRGIVFSKRSREMDYPITGTRSTVDASPPTESLAIEDSKKKLDMIKPYHEGGYVLNTFKGTKERRSASGSSPQLSHSRDDNPVTMSESSRSADPELFDRTSRKPKHSRITTRYSCHTRRRHSFDSSWVMEPFYRSIFGERLLGSTDFLGNDITDEFMGAFQPRSNSREAELDFCSKRMGSQDWGKWVTGSRPYNSPIKHTQWNRRFHRTASLKQPRSMWVQQRSHFSLSPKKTAPGDMVTNESARSSAGEQSTFTPPSFVTGTSTVVHHLNNDATSTGEAVGTTTSEQCEGTVPNPITTNIDQQPISRPNENTSEMDTLDTQEEQSALTFQIPEEALEAAKQAPPDSAASFWRHDLYRGPDNKKIPVHYCQTFEVADRVAKHFLNEKIVGFDIEWKPNCSSSDGIKENASLIQLSSADRIALFHISIFPGTTVAELVPPTLKAVMESSDILKVGVAIKADCTRLRNFLEIDAKGLFELSHLYKLVKFSVDEPEKVNKHLVGLAQQVQEHLQLPLFKGDVRQSDWSKKLNMEQILYAASDAYAGIRVFYALEAKRLNMDPVPPRPEPAELNLPIKFPAPKAVTVSDAAANDIDDTDLEQIDASSSELSGSDLEVSSEGESDLESTSSKEDPDAEYVPPTARRIGRARLPISLPVDPGYPVLPTLPSESVTVSSSSVSPNDHITNLSEKLSGTHIATNSSLYGPTTFVTEERSMAIPKDKEPAQQSTPLTKNPQYIEATAWAKAYLDSVRPSVSPSKPHATVPHLRAYQLWYHQHLSVKDIAKLLRDPPLSPATVCGYIYSAVALEKLPARKEEWDKVKSALPYELRKKWGYVAQ